MVDRVNLDTGTVLFQNIGFTLPDGEEVFQSAPISTVRMYMEAEEANEGMKQEQKPQSESIEPPLKVGDTVYLDDTAFEITEIGLFDVQMRDPTLQYPVFRSESKERLMQMLHQDERNQFIFDREEPQSEFVTETVAVLSKYVGWGGLADAFDETKDNCKTNLQSFMPHSLRKNMLQREVLR